MLLANLSLGAIFLLKTEEHVAKEFLYGPQQSKTSLHNIGTRSMPRSLLNASKKNMKEENEINITLARSGFEFKHEGV